MWSAVRTALRSGEKIVISRSGAGCSFAEVVAGWRDSEEFRAFFIRELAAAPFPAFFWEMPPIRRDTTGRTYEFVTIRSDALARMPPDADAFAGQFQVAEGPIATFRNLGGDATLVAPTPIGDSACYTHIAAFLRAGPLAQQHELFVSLSRAIDQELRLGPARLWISTSGLGVAWLHVRLESFPKYYQHRPYAEAD